MCEMKVGWERGRGGGRSERKTQPRGREEPCTTNSPSLSAQPAILQLLVDIDPGGAVNHGGAAWKVSAGEPPPMVPQALQGLAITLEPLQQTLPLSRLSTPPPLHSAPATHMYALLSWRSALKPADRTRDGSIDVSRGTPLASATDCPPSRQFKP